MSEALQALIALAAGLGFFHTVAGPDHYLPFVVISRARRWSWRRTALMTLGCGLGHVLSSVVLGIVGVAVGLAISRVETVESTRGEIAAWLMIAFGLVYAAWGCRRWFRTKSHSHDHAHDHAGYHVHEHSHEGAHIHPHSSPLSGSNSGRKDSLTPWILFTIFLFGPCEVLIPLLLYPAAQESILGMSLVAAVFTAATLGTMLVMVLSLRYGFERLRFDWLEKNMHAAAGLTISLCGALILVGF